MKISATKSASGSTKRFAKMAFLATLMTNACGKNTGQVDSSISTLAIANDSSLSAGLVNANYSDALATATSQGASTTLALSQDQNDQSAVTRTCVEDGVNAVVQISGAIEKSKIMTSPDGDRTIEHSITGSSTMKRTWSNTTGTAVTCNSEKSAAQISWTSPDNLKLEAEFERSRAREMKITTPKFEKDFSGTFKSSGKRTLIWGTSSTSADTADSYFRTHTATMESTREMTISNDSGVKKDIQLKVATKEAAPLVVSVERSVSGNAVLSRTIVSGTLVTQKDVEEGSASVTESEDSEGRGGRNRRRRRGFVGDTTGRPGTTFDYHLLLPARGQFVRDHSQQVVVKAPRRVGKNDPDWLGREVRCSLHLREQSGCHQQRQNDTRYDSCSKHSNPPCFHLTRDHCE